MDIREKLVELLDEAYRNAEETCRKTDCENCCVSSKPVNSCVMTLIADNLITNGVQVQEWIPVTEWLPNVFEGVLAYCPKRRNTYLLYLNARGEWHFFDKTVAGALLDEAVTHWMPLPTPPKGE